VSKVLAPDASCSGNITRVSNEALEALHVATRRETQKIYTSISDSNNNNNNDIIINNNNDDMRRWQ